MSEKTFEIQVQTDHLERVAQTRKPILAVAELIWNALDADAELVSVVLTNDSLGGLATVEITDDGHGIPYSDAEELFSKLGGSWKQRERQSHDKHRILHGKDGRGRFRAFALGRVVDWNVRYHADDSIRRYRISMVKDQLNRVRVSEEEPAQVEDTPGVTVVLSELARDFRSLRSPNGTNDITQIFALYLRQYPSTQLTYDGIRINPSSVQEQTTSYELQPLTMQDGDVFQVSLEIVEWKMPAERALFVCDEDGFPLDFMPPGVQAPGFSFTAYLKSRYCSELASKGALDLANMEKPFENILFAVRSKIRDHFRTRAAEKAAGLVEEWRQADVYPYSGEPVTLVEKVERQVFNVVALNVNSYLPDFSTADNKSKKLQLHLLRQSIERAPADLSRILTEVLGLPIEKRRELAALLERTTLAAIINASKIVSDRLEFLRGLELLVFDDDFKNRTRERSQLHRIVAENSWMFGEQYHLSVDDESLTEVLKKHLASQGREVEIDESVKRPDGRRGIVDLMFSRNTSRPGTPNREHLVVELKRPNVDIDAKAADQVESYALAVAKDERFRDANTKWVFWAISSEMTEQIRERSCQTNRTPGILFENEKSRITIWVKTWGQLLEECRARLRFFQEKLQYTPDRDRSLEHLKVTYDKYLADLFASPVAETELAPEDEIPADGVEADFKS